MDLDERNRGIIEDYDPYTALINEDSPTSDDGEVKKQQQQNTTKKHRRRHTYSSSASSSSSKGGLSIMRMSFRDVFRSTTKKSNSKHKKKNSGTEVLLDHTAGGFYSSCSTKDNTRSPKWKSVSWNKLFSDGPTDKPEDDSPNKKKIQQKEKDAANPPVKKVVVVSLVDEDNSKGGSNNGNLTMGNENGHSKLEYHLTTGLRTVSSQSSSDDDDSGDYNKGAASSTASCTTATSSVSTGSVGSYSSSGSISHIIRDLTSTAAAKAAAAAAANATSTASSPTADLASLLPSLANLTGGTPSASSIASNDDISIASSEKVCLVFLMDPKRKIFEIIQVPYHAETTTVSGLLEQLPNKATDKRLAELSYTGLAYQGVKLHQASLVLLSVVIDKMNEFATEETEPQHTQEQVRRPKVQTLLPVPDGCTADEVEHIARILMQSPKVKQLIDLHLAKMAASAVRRTVENTSNLQQKPEAEVVEEKETELTAREQIRLLYNKQTSRGVVPLSTMGEKPKHNPKIQNNKTVNPFYPATVAL